MKGRIEECLCALWGMCKPWCLQMSSLDPSEVFQVPEVNMFSLLSDFF